MWVIWTLVILAVLLWLGLVWLSALIAKYSHSIESSLVLLSLGVASFWAGRQVVRQIAPEWELGPVIGASIAVGFLVFSLLSYVVVNLWLALLTKEYDERIAILEEEEDQLLRDLESTRWQSLRAGPPEGPQEKPQAPPRQDEAKALADFVDGWEQEGGAARIRSLKVLEWKDEISRMSEEGLEEHIREQRRLSETETDDVRKEQARVRLALAKLEGLSRTPVKDPKEVLPKSQRPVLIAPDQALLRQRLQDIHRNISTARSDKSLFLRQKVSLRWRRRQ